MRSAVLTLNLGRRWGGGRRSCPTVRLVRHRPVLTYEVLTGDGVALVVGCHVVIDQGGLVHFAWIGRSVESALSVAADDVRIIRLRAVDG